MSEWQQIDTAPRDGTHITVSNQFNPAIPAATVHWFDGGWHLSVNQMGEYSEYVWGPPTHWMPSPAPPAFASQARPERGDYNAD